MKATIRKASRQCLDDREVIKVEFEYDAHTFSFNMNPATYPSDQVIMDHMKREVLAYEERKRAANFLSQLVGRSFDL